MKNRQKRIVIASLLKPVDDTRMYEKMAMSLAASGEFEIDIIGFPSRRSSEHSNIHFRPLRRFSRLSLKRLLTPLEVFQKIIQVKPEVLIVNTHELLIVAIANRILFGSKIIYDIRENYYRNIRYTNAFPALIRDVLALWVRFKEKALAPAFHHFFLAEKGYEKEMNFFRKSYSVIENKAVLPDHFRKAPRSPKGIQLLFSGTLADTTGIFQAIELTKALFEHDQTISLKIVGYCAQPHILAKIHRAVENTSFITLEGGDQLVPHYRIMMAISESDFGIICYTPSLHTENCIPTKLYEYLAARLPILLQDHRPWVEICLPFKAAVAIDFTKIDVQAIHSEMTGRFYTATPENVLWQSEANELIRVLQAL